MREFTVVIEKDEDDWLISSVLELPGCHSRKDSRRTHGEL